MRRIASAVEQIAAGSKHAARDYRVAKLSGNWIHKTERLAIYMRDGFNKLAKKSPAWSQLIQCTTYKAEWAGRCVRQVYPHNTSQACSGCGSIVEKDLSVRIHSCSGCGLTLDRDHNAAINILALGLQSIPQVRMEAESF